LHADRRRAINDKHSCTYTGAAQHLRNQGLRRRSGIHTRRWICFITTLLCLIAETGSSQTLPVRANAGNRYLEDQSGIPFLLTGDAAWSLFTYISVSDAKYYLDQRASQGFNTVITALPPPWILYPVKGQNLYGVRPWTGTPFTTPNEAYFAHADTIIDYAASKGITVVIVPAFIGYHCSVDGYGWSVEIQARSNAEMRAWGSWLGARYKSRKNIIWSAGGDCDPTTCPTVLEKMVQMIEGIREQDAVSLITNHNQRVTTGMDYYAGAAWMTLNNIYVTPATTARLAGTARSLSPAKPFFLIEGYFEGDQYAPTQQTLRAQTYWTMLAGGCGFVYGSVAIYEFGNNFADPLAAPNPVWKTALTNAASMHQVYAKNLFSSRQWHKLDPYVQHTVVTSGYGTIGTTTYAAAAATTDSVSIFAYLPTQRTITVNPSVMKGDSIRVAWFNPSTGAYASSSRVSKATRSYTPPSAGDWVLVMDTVTVSAPVVNPPAAPVVSVPAQGAVNVPTTVTMRWSKVPAAAQYHAQVSTGSAFQTFVVNDSTLTDTMRIVAGLANNTGYYLRVRAGNSAGWGSFSTASQFTTIGTVPAAPVLVSPTNGATGIAINPSLTWNTSGGAVSYSVQVATDSIFTAPVVSASGVASTSYGVSALANNRKYYWRVNAVNTIGPGAWSSIRGFTTNGVVPPAPVLVSPSNAATDIAINPVLTWTASGGAVSYSVQVATDSIFAAPVVSASGVASTSYGLSALSNNRKYYWRVNAVNGVGTGAWSSIRSFTTVGLPPAPPELVSPLNGATDIATNVQLVWNASSGAVAYTVTVATDSVFANVVVIKGGIAGTSDEVGGLAYSRKYYWRVNAANAVGSGQWSSVRSFTTVAGSSAIPILTAPADGATGISTNPLLSWDVSSGAVSYRLQVSSDAGFSSGVIEHAGITSTSFAITGLAENRVYYWRVNASAPAGPSAWSAVRSFTTIVAAPGVPVPASPPDGASVVGTDLLVSWNPVGGAESYRLNISPEPTFSSGVSVYNDITTNSYPVTELTVSTTYYWRVSAVNSGGNSAWSPVQRFSTTIAIPPTPVPASPVDGATGISPDPVLVWNGSSSAVSFTLHISRDSSFTSDVTYINDISSSTYALSSLAYATQYFWRVNASNTGGTSPWSVVNSFTVAGASLVAQQTGTVPLEYAVDIFPNPFNSSTTVRFSLPRSTVVRIAIFNSLGKDVETLVNAALPAGIYSQIWNAAGLPSGMYFFRLQAGEHIATKRVIFLQ